MKNLKAIFVLSLSIISGLSADITSVKLFKSSTQQPKWVGVVGYSPDVEDSEKAGKQRAQLTGMIDRYVEGQPPATEFRPCTKSVIGESIYYLMYSAPGTFYDGYLSGGMQPEEALATGGYVIALVEAQYISESLPAMFKAHTLLGYTHFFVLVPEDQVDEICTNHLAEHKEKELDTLDASQGFVFELKQLKALI